MATGGHFEILFFNFFQGKKLPHSMFFYDEALEDSLLSLI
jgi:hypothetical protein